MDFVLEEFGYNVPDYISSLDGFTFSVLAVLLIYEKMMRHAPRYFSTLTVELKCIFCIIQNQGGIHVRGTEQYIFLTQDPFDMTFKTEPTPLGWNSEEKQLQNGHSQFQSVRKIC